MNQRMCPETNETATCSLSHTKHILQQAQPSFYSFDIMVNWSWSLHAKHWYDKEKGGCLPYKHSPYNSPSPCGRGCCSHCRTGTCTASSWSACSRPSSERTGTCSEDMLWEDEIRAKTFQCNRNNWHRWKHTFKLCVCVCVVREADWCTNRGAKHWNETCGCGFRSSLWQALLIPLSLR